MKKTWSGILVFTLLIALFWAPQVQAAEPDSIVILCTNDVHCSMEQKTGEDGAVTNIGYTGVAAYKKEMEAKYGASRVTLLDAGDAIQGEAIGTLSSGAYPVEMMNRVGYDFAVPGNHEFDYGMDTFRALTKKAEYQYLCCNFIDKTGTPVFKPYSIVDYGQIQVAYVGVSTPETFTKSTPTYFQDGAGNYIYSFSEGEGKLYASIQSAVGSARAEGADYVVAVSHLGEEGSTAAWRSDTVIANTTGIDVLLDGHSHEQYKTEVKNKTGDEVLMLQTGTKLSALGKVVINPTSGNITGELVTGYAESDPDVSAYLQTIHAEFEEVLGQVVAKTDIALTTLDSVTGKRAIRNAETNLGDLCADAYRLMLGADVGLVNGGGIRADVAAGPITYEQIINVQPYGNQLCLAEVTGQQLLDALEMGVRLYPEENGGFLQVSGLTYHIDTGIASSVEVNDKNEFVKVAGQRRVKEVKVDGKPLEPSTIYRLATHDYMLKSGGDGLVMFRDCKILEDEVMLDNQALIRYIKERLNGAVGAVYSNPLGQGRISILSKNAQEQSAEPNAEVQVYVVVRGDCLWNIAAKQLGTGIRWQEIYRLNQTIIFDPNFIYAGQELRLPA